MLESTKIGHFEYYESNIIGEGAYSQVYLAQSQNGKTAAIKKIRKSLKDEQSYKLAKK